MKKAVKKKETKEKGCLCPFCEGELLVAGAAFCQGCSALLSYCSTCKIMVERGVKNCPRCGAPLGQATD